MNDDVRLSWASKQVFADWLNTFQFTFFVTLATNDGELRSANRSLIRGRQRADQMVALARAWDGRMNRVLLGPRWSQPLYKADRMLACYFLEKPHTNPHWHALIRIDDADPDRRARKVERLHDQAESIWLSLIPSGSVIVRGIRDETIAKYVAKELGRPLCYEHFILPDAFATRPASRTRSGSSSSRRVCQATRSTKLPPERCPDRALPTRR